MSMPYLISDNIEWNNSPKQRNKQEEMTMEMTAAIQNKNGQIQWKRLILQYEKNQSLRGILFIL